MEESPHGGYSSSLLPPSPHAAPAPSSFRSHSGFGSSLLPTAPSPHASTPMLSPSSQPPNWSTHSTPTLQYSSTSPAFSSSSTPSPTPTPMALSPAPLDSPSSHMDVSMSSSTSPAPSSPLNSFSMFESQQRRHSPVHQAQVQYPRSPGKRPREYEAMDYETMAPVFEKRARGSLDTIKPEVIQALRMVEQYEGLASQHYPNYSPVNIQLSHDYLKNFLQDVDRIQRDSRMHHSDLSQRTFDMGPTKGRDSKYSLLDSKGVKVSKKFSVISPNTMRRQLNVKKQSKMANSVGKKPPPSFALHHFEVISTLGYAGYATTQLCKSSKNRKYYCLKSFYKSTLVGHQQLSHLQQESSILRALNYVGAVKLFGSCSDDLRIYLFLEFVPGGELLTHIRQHGRFPSHVAKFFAAELILALSFLHEHKICYRDLKPENILLDLKGHIKLANFSFARYLRPNERSWTMCGTPDYLAPEVLSGNGYSYECDWWSLGVVIFEMSTGYPPFTAPKPAMVITNISRAEELQYPPFIDPDCVSFIRALLRSSPLARMGVAVGSENMQSHAWFVSEPVIQWQHFARRQGTGPIIPDFSSASVNYPPVPVDHSRRFVHDPAVQLPPEAQQLFHSF
eukprot:TRINITY_DN1276_c0_g1_i1.p1 TRINITY_DN1276_c0_g1~~TRINITY_DN1276_c0_g1_i1.p1  ORF type:complete len:700 (+),score=81.45 TRINITY_DN1276_c0_g1_i1:239-2101(+)